MSIAHEALQVAHFHRFFSNLAKVIERRRRQPGPCDFSFCGVSAAGGGRVTSSVSETTTRPESGRRIRSKEQREEATPHSTALR
jgi:hypothetical protein